MRRLTLLAVALSFCFASRSFAGPVTDADVRSLVARLGNDDAATREEAEAALRKLPPAWRETLREAVKTSSDPEVRSRLAAVISAMGLPKWHTDTAAAIAESSESKKPLLIFATPGGPDSFS